MKQLSKRIHYDIVLCQLMPFNALLNFNTHIKENIAKANKGIGIICKLAHLLPRESLIIIYKSFVRPHIDIVM